MTLLVALDRFNQAHPWSHNDSFARFVVRRARRVARAGGSRRQRALDVGCGTGNLVEHLSGIFSSVVGVRPDPTAARLAAKRFTNSPSVEIEQRCFGDEEPNRYDFIVFVASLHHMPLVETLRCAKQSLRSGGWIVIVGVARETCADTTRSMLSLVLNPLVGLVRHPSRATGTLLHMQAPTAAPVESFEEIRRTARDVLPGIRMRRRLFWRYTATWRSSD